MTKNAFLTELHQRLSGLEKEALEQRLAFYDEIIEEYVRGGVPEEEAVAKVGAVDVIVAQVMSEIPLTRLVARKIPQKKSWNAGKIVALILTFPFWLPFVIVIVTLLLTLYILLWALVLSLFAVDAGLFCLSVLGFVSIVPLSAENPALVGLVAGGAFLCAGLFMLLFFLGIMAAKGVVAMGGQFLLWLKSSFVGKEGSSHA